MLLKSKICFTVLAVYEMIAVSILHFQRLCDSILFPAFCDSWYRYFLFCVIVPLIFILIWMWIAEIIRIRRRRSFIRRAKNTVHDIMGAIRGKITENISVDDMEKIITAAVLFGIKRYADRHPNLRRNVNNIIDVANGELDLDIMATDDEVIPKRNTKRAATVRTKTASKAVKKRR